MDVAEVLVGRLIKTFEIEKYFGRLVLLTFNEYEVCINVLPYYDGLPKE
jgi:hypothetical protein